MKWDLYYYKVSRFKVTNIFVNKRIHYRYFPYFCVTPNSQTLLKYRIMKFIFSTMITKMVMATMTKMKLMNDDKSADNDEDNGIISDGDDDN